ncbi:MAG: hypothetical protein GC160_00705 [Acidobacteria bacterium]|nr:hypothetical protein [Acidobacteriota bacterium]
MRWADSPVRHYLICADPRTGSSLLGYGLWSSDRAGRPDELLEAETLRKHGWQDDPPAVLLEKAFRQGETPNGVSGLKVMWPDLERLASATPPATAEQLRGLAELLPPLRYIRITRRDVVSQAVSLAKAMQTGQWQFDKTPRTRTVIYRREEISAQIRAIHSYNAGWARYFETLGVEPLHIVYEDFVDNYDSTMRAVFAYLELPPDPVPPPLLERQADEVSRAWVERYLHPGMGERVEMAVASLRRRLAPRPRG